MSCGQLCVELRLGEGERLGERALRGEPAASTALWSGLASVPERAQTEEIGALENEPGGPTVPRAASGSCPWLAFVGPGVHTALKLQAGATVRCSPLKQPASPADCPADLGA